MGFDRTKDPRIDSTHGVEPGREREGAPGALKENGQHSSYWVLSEEERKKGFVRPVRDSYVHVGERPIYPLRSLTEDEKERFKAYGYSAFEIYPEAVVNETGKTGRYWTKAQLRPRCRRVTKMSDSIAETYARDPSFYGSTFCATCGTHFPVAEFLWADGSGERVGS